MSVSCIENTYRSVKKFCKLDTPAGSAFNRIVRLNPAYGKDLIPLIDHMENNLKDFSDFVCLCIPPAHACR